MSKVTFCLADPAAKYTPVILYYTCSDGRLKYYTRQKASTKNWPDTDKGTRAILNRITDLVHQSEVDHKIKGQRLTKATLKGSLDLLLNKTKKAKDNFFTLADSVIEKMRSGELLTDKKKRYAASTIKSISLTKRKLEEFDPDLSGAGTTIETYYRFITWCHAQNFSTNYTGTLIKNWKTLGNQGTDNPVFRDPEFKKIAEETHAVYLDESELKELEKVDCPPAEQLARNWFLIGCYTGLRVSDLLSLSKRNISDKFITIATEKTDEKVVIPLHPTVKKIIKKYKGFPPSITDVEVNRMIKITARRAGINEDVLITTTKGGKREDRYLKKWQVIRSHTMRRSAITNMQSRKDPVPTAIIKKITGIKSDKTLARYTKLTADEAAKIAAGMDFFK